MAHQKYIGAPNTSPLPATLRAIEQQATPELKDAALGYARRRVKLLRWAGRPVSATSARELVDDVHADTWAGDLPWDPSQCSLLEHFRQAIKQRTWLEIRISFVPLPDAANEEAMPDRPAFEEVEQALAVIVSDRCAPSRWLAMLEATCHELRARIDLVAALCLLPNIAYLVWRKRNRFPVCPACGHIDLVPSDSPLAAALRRGASEPLPPS